MTRIPNSLSQLLALDDTSFVDGAYRAVLRREPDPVGFEDFVTQIRLGVAKERVLVAMAVSDEGRAAKSPMPGLEELCRSHPLHPRSGVLSRLMRRLRGGSGERLEAQVRALDNRVGRLQAHRAQEAELEGALQRSLLQQLEAMGALLREVAHAVSEAEARDAERLADVRAVRQAIDTQLQQAHEMALRLQALAAAQDAAEAASIDRIDDLARFVASRLPKPAHQQQAFAGQAHALGESGRFVLDQIRRVASATPGTH